jgi:hypothetical protein
MIYVMSRITPKAEAGPAAKLEAAGPSLNQ